MASPAYPGDLTDVEWALLAPLMPPAKPGGRPRSVTIRRILDGLVDVLRSGCAWRYLPRAYGPWQTAYWYFSAMAPRRRLDGTWACLQGHLRELARLLAGRDPTPARPLLAASQ